AIFLFLAIPDAPGTPEPTNITGDSITLTWARPFHVMAENAAGVGPPSDVSKLIKCREPVSPPSAPNVVKVTDTSKTSVSLEWTKPVFDGGMEIIGYIIEMCKADLEAWQKVNAETVLATKYTVVDLEAGEHYKFRVSAVNGAGKGESCEIPASVQTVDRLSAPEIDIDANFKQTHIVRAGASIRLFIAFSGRPVPTAVWSKADANLSLRADIQTTDSFSTLTVEECNRNDAGKYVFTVENNSGSKSITFTVKVLDTPGPPGPITFKDVTRGSITLMWDAPVLDGGSRIHHYIVEKREASRRSWQVVSSKCTRQIFKVPDLAEGVPYYYRVSAENEYGVGEPCELTEPVVATEEPAPPKRLDIVDTTKSSVVLAWLKPDHDGGSRVTGYLLEMKQKGSDSWIAETERVTIKTTKDRTTLTVKDSMRGDSGKYYLTLENTAGLKTFAVTVVVIGRPGPVIGPIEISSVSAESCVLTWKEPEDDGGSEITNYIVEKRESGTTAWQLVNSSVKRTQVKVTHLTKYQEYSFRVSSENRFGVSKPLESKTIVAEHPFGK
uniref:Titin n=1 Tax=Strigops habroptila TaxID=2489341 RepID=A0A672TG49_STRHB